MVFTYASLSLETDTRLGMGARGSRPGGGGGGPGPRPYQKGATMPSKVSFSPMWYLGLSARTRKSQERAIIQPPAGQAPCRESQTAGPCSVPEGQPHLGSVRSRTRTPLFPQAHVGLRAASLSALVRSLRRQSPIRPGLSPHVLPQTAWGHPCPHLLHPLSPWRWPATQPHASSQARPPSSPAGSGPWPPPHPCLRPEQCPLEVTTGPGSRPHTQPHHVALSSHLVCKGKLTSVGLPDCPLPF